MDSGKRGGVPTETAENVKALGREVRDCGKPTKYFARLQQFYPGGASRRFWRLFKR